MGKNKEKYQIDKSKIDPKNNWAYKLYYYTRKINYVNKATLFIYLSYLIKSISNTLSNINIEKINPESFLKLRAETNVVSMNVFNSIVNPILAENGVRPKLISWASSWFIKKISARIVLKTIKSKNVDLTLPYVKKFLDEVNKENLAIKRFFIDEISIHIYLLLLITLQCCFFSEDNLIHSLTDLFLILLFITPLFFY